MDGSDLSRERFLDCGGRWKIRDGVRHARQNTICLFVRGKRQDEVQIGAQPSKRIDLDETFLKAMFDRCLVVKSFQVFTKV